MTKKNSGRKRETIALSVIFSREKHRVLSVERIQFRRGSGGADIEIVPGKMTNRKFFHLPNGNRSSRSLVRALAESRSNFLSPCNCPKERRISLRMFDHVIISCTQGKYISFVHSDSMRRQSADGTYPPTPLLLLTPPSASARSCYAFPISRIPAPLHVESDAFIRLPRGLSPRSREFSFGIRPDSSGYRLHLKAKPPATRLLHPPNFSNVLRAQNQILKYEDTVDSRLFRVDLEEDKIYFTSWTLVFERKESSVS